MANGAYEGHMANRKVRGSFLFLEQTKEKKQFGGRKKKKGKEKKKRNEKKRKEKEEKKENEEN